MNKWFTITHKEGDTVASVLLKGEHDSIDAVGAHDVLNAIFKAELRRAENRKWYIICDLFAEASEVSQLLTISEKLTIAGWRPSVNQKVGGKDE